MQYDVKIYLSISSFYKGVYWFCIIIISVCEWIGFSNLNPKYSRAAPCAATSHSATHLPTQISI